jgi:acetylornithine/succinyldiaminopimelate/putrescine aminotransferase
MCAAARAVLEHVLTQDIPGNAARVGAYLMERLNALRVEIPLITEVRGQGLLQAVAFRAEISDAVVRAAIEERLLLNPVTPNAVRMMPPLNITRAEVDEAVEKLGRALQRVVDRQQIEVSHA